MEILEIGARQLAATIGTSKLFFGGSLKPMGPPEKELLFATGSFSGGNGQTSKHYGRYVK